MEESNSGGRAWSVSPDFLARVLVALGLTALATVLLLVAWTAYRILFVVFLGILAGILLDGIGGVVSRVLPISRRWAVRAVLLVVAVALGVVGWVWGDDLARQFSELFRELPAAFASLHEQLGRQGWSRAFAGELPDLQAVAANLDVGRITGAFSSAMGAMAGLFIVLFVGLYSGMSPHRYVDNATRLIPPASRRRGVQVLEATHHALQYWLLGRLADMCILAVLTSVGLLILGIPYAVPLGITAGLLAFVPYIGPILSVVPAVLVAMNADQANAVLHVLVLYGAIQLVESYLITPLIDQKAVDVPPAMGLAMQAIFAVVGGAIGVIVAVPLTVVLIVLVQALYLQDGMGEDVHVIGEDEG